MSVDRLLAPFEALVKRFTSRLDYCALYACRVVGQNVDGTLELQPDDARMPQLSGVSIRHGIPGVSVSIAAGSRVLLGFEDASPAKPFAALWQADSVTEIRFNGGTKAVARVTDTVGADASMTTWIGLVHGVVAPLYLAATGLAMSPPTDFGKITGGAAAVKA